MSYRVFLHPKAAEALAKLNPDLKNRIKSILKSLEDSPETRGERLRPSAFWRIRIGDYRAIYEIDRNDRRIIVLYIGHRKNVYDDFARLT